MSDTIVQYGNSLLQHGKSNDRVYLMKVCAEDSPALVEMALQLAEENGYSKIFVKASQDCITPFVQNGFMVEARVPKLFMGKDDGFFLSSYVDPERAMERNQETVESVLGAAQKHSMERAPTPSLAPCFEWQVMGKEDVDEMARLYRAVFASYPFPIDDPAYLARTMDENIIYHGIRQEGELIALSSAEIDAAGQNVEMTDFATREDFRGQGLATYLLDRMEVDVRVRGIQTSFTIARAYSFGMNITFARHGYTFAGTLTNNTQISGQLESMNVWYTALNEGRKAS